MLLFFRFDDLCCWCWFVIVVGEKKTRYESAKMRELFCFVERARKDTTSERWSLREEKKDATLCGLRCWRIVLDGLICSSPLKPTNVRLNSIGI